MQHLCLRVKSLPDRATNWQKLKGNGGEDLILKMRPNWRKEWASWGLGGLAEFWQQGASEPVGAVLAV